MKILNGLPMFDYLYNTQPFSGDYRTFSVHNEVVDEMRDLFQNAFDRLVSFSTSLGYVEPIRSLPQNFELVTTSGLTGEELETANNWLKHLTGIDMNWRLRPTL